MKHLLALLTLITVLSCKKEVKEDKQVQVNTPTAEVVKKEYEVETLDSVQLFSGSLQRLRIVSEFIEDRPVDVWLPEGYSADKSYAVLYMHDGQMLFDANTTWNKQEWKVDEWATQLMAEGKTQEFIVVGIHNISGIRWFDLFPQKAVDYLNEEDYSYQDLNGDNYLRFLIKELKPIIDNEYAVKTDREHTFVAGSSMGGLMSMYVLSEYPEIFKGAACISTHWVGAAPEDNNPFPEAIFSYMEASFPTAGEHLVYFDYGNQTLDRYYPQYAPRVDAILKAKGYTEADSKNLFFEGTNHSENAWNQRLNAPLEFLLGPRK